MAGSKQPSRRPSERQAAVLAAVERLGRPMMADLWEQFPDMQPSAIKKVLDSLESKGLVEHAGEESKVYLNGVHWWSTALSATEYPPDVARVAEAVEAADLGVDHNADPHEEQVTVFIPLVEVEGDLQSLPSRPLDRLRSCIQHLEASGTFVRLTIAGITAGAESQVIVKLSPTRT
jgi:hypothetical protein